MGNYRAGVLVKPRRARAQFVKAAMDVCVILAIIPGYFIDHTGGMLSRGRIVQINEGTPVDFLFKDREISAIFLSQQIGRHAETSTAQRLVATRAMSLLQCLSQFYE